MWPFKKRIQYFNVGDTVKCINDLGWDSTDDSISLIYGQNYKILMVVKCPTCGKISYDIGARFTNVYINKHTICGGNNPHLLPGKGLHLAGDFRFEKTIQDKEEIKIEMEKAIKNEEYMEAAKLRDILERL